jgi:hypothetical protein
MKGLVHSAESVQHVESRLHRRELLAAVEDQLEAHPRRLGSQILRRSRNESVIPPGKRAIDLDLLRIELRLEHLRLMCTLERCDPKLVHESAIIGLRALDV